MIDGPEDDAPRDGELYVITLCTASLPMVLRVPFVHELVGFSVFRSRTVEDGRERFRLYVGYFDSASRAHEALAVVRKHYPAAWISCAPRSNLGSLDDTMNTAFRLIRRATARVVERAPAPIEIPEPRLPPPLTDIVQRGDPAPAPVLANPSQRYVVQLDWSDTPIPASEIPQLALLRAYNLYRAVLPRAEGAQHALRLGFFKNPHNARQVAEYIRGHFPKVGIVPISDREYARAMELFDRRAHPRPDSSAANEPVAAAPTVAPVSPAPAPAPVAAAVKEIPDSTSADNRAERSREQLLAMLGADDLKMDETDARELGGLADDAIVAPRRQPRNVRSW